MKPQDIYPTPEAVGKAFRVVLDKLNEANLSTNSHECYGCLACRHYQRREVYDEQWGMIRLGQFKCKVQPDRDMMLVENTYYDAQCPCFERGENEIIPMAENNCD